MPGPELLSDPRAELASQNLVLQPGTHVVLPDGRWLSCVKRYTRRDDLFLYYHRRTGNFVVAVWLYPKKWRTFPVCSELEILSGHPDENPPELMPAQAMMRRVKMTTDGQVRQFRQKLRDRRGEHIRRMDAEREYKASVVKHLRGKGMSHTAFLIDSGQMPFAGTSRGKDEHMDQTRDKLLGMLEK